MEMRLRPWAFGKELDLVVREDVSSEWFEESLFSNFTENGKAARDISTYWLVTFQEILYEMLSEREREYDSSDLIEKFFEKLPKEKAKKLANALYEEYYEDKTGI